MRKIDLIQCFEQSPSPSPRPHTIGLWHVTTEITYKGSAITIIHKEVASYYYSVWCIAFSQQNTSTGVQSVVIQGGSLRIGISYTKWHKLDSHRSKHAAYVLRNTARDLAPASSRDYAIAHGIMPSNLAPELGSPQHHITRNVSSKSAKTQHKKHAMQHNISARISSSSHATHPSKRTRKHQGKVCHAILDLSEDQLIITYHATKQECKATVLARTFHTTQKENKETAQKYMLCNLSSYTSAKISSSPYATQPDKRTQILHWCQQVIQSTKTTKPQHRRECHAT